MLRSPFIILLLLGASSSASANPINKVVSMISGLQNRIVEEGNEAQRLYTEFAEMCSDRSRELHNEIKTSKANGVQLSATIEKATADDAVLDDKIDDTSGGMSDSESELKKATELRAKESADFKSEQAELMKTISTIERAITVIEREGAGASMAQLQNAQDITQVLQAMSEAEAINSYDAAKLTALVQQSSSEESSDGDEDAGASKAKGGSQIVDTLGALLDKTQKQLDDARNAERQSQNAFDMLRQSLTDKIKTMTRELGDSKKSKAATAETKASAQGNLEMTTKDHAEDEKELAELHRECLDKATSFEEATNSRNEELKALTEAKKIITSVALAQTAPSSESFLQVASKSKAKAKADLSFSSKALHMVRHIAMTYEEQSMLELASRMEKAIQRSSASGSDPFNKIKGMIDAMINKLEKQAGAEAKKKQYCDQEMGMTKQSQEDKTWAIDKLNTQIDVMVAQSKTLKGETARLEKELGALARNQAEMGKLRQEEKSVYAKNKPELEQGLSGVKNALKVLRDYYAQDSTNSGSADGTAGGIIGMLEVVESDFSKGLAEMQSTEESAAAEYQEATQENEVAKAEKTQDAKYKKAEYVGLDKTIAELRSDKSGATTELNAVNEYMRSIEKECVAKPDSYEERKKRRDAEMAGLREALDTLGGEAMFLQVQSHRTLRGARHVQVGTM